MSVSKRLILEVSVDLCLIVLVSYLAWVLRLATLSLPGEYRHLWTIYLVPQVTLRLAALAAFRQYRVCWRYFGLHELRWLIAATTVASALFAMLVLSLTPHYPLSVLAISWMLNILLIGGVRVAYRMAYEGRGGRGLRGSEEQPRLLIIGAGNFGEGLARELLRRANGGRPIGFVDDDARKRGLLIHGLPVLGAVEDVTRIAREQAVDEVVIAIPSATGTQIRRILGYCEELPVRLRTCPGFSDLRPGDGARQLRRIELSDLLRRPPVKIHLESIANYLTGERVLITGAGGSIGSELVRQVMQFGPEAIFLLGQGENSLFEIQQELRREHRYEGAVPIVGDIKDMARMRQIFERYHPTVIFHAAAHKHVPMMEANATEAVKNNVLGTRNLVTLAAENRVKRFLMVSSDKAVNPTSVMGATKRVAELVLQAEAQRLAARGTLRTQFMAVRFGNVLGSRGSVVPTMLKQIERGGPVTVTHPEMVRYFMTIPEAVQLVLQAGALGSRGEVFLLDMGEPVKVLDLARDLIRLMGLIPGRDVKIEFTGLRPGEKLYEELLTAQEGVGATLHEHVFTAPPAPVDHHALHTAINGLAELAWRGDEEGVRRKLREIVPTYRRDDAERATTAPQPVPVPAPWRERSLARPGVPEAQPGLVATTS
jgi:FlaA1/EpsC-like NDP-sugar epimerase